MRRFSGLAVAAALLLAGGAARQARAGVVQTGGTYTLNNINFVDNFSTSVTLDGTGVNKPIDNGQLFINEQIFPTGPNGAWVQFNFSTANGGPLAGNLNAHWETDIGSIPFTTPVVYDGFFSYFSVNGVPFSNILAGDFTDVETNPVTGVGQVLGTAVTPSSPLTSLSVYEFFDPYSILQSQNNIDPMTANGFSLAVHVDNLVPEPGGMTLVGVALGGLITGAWRRRRRAASAA
jgi:hypothetical protein